MPPAATSNNFAHGIAGYAEAISQLLLADQPLIGANESLVYEVEFEDTAVLTDLDTPEQWSEYLAKPRS